MQTPQVCSAFDGVTFLPVRTSSKSHATLLGVLFLPVRLLSWLDAILAICNTGQIIWDNFFDFRQLPFFSFLFFVENLKMAITESNKGKDMFST